jgi:hypothetical protein
LTRVCESLTPSKRLFLIEKDLKNVFLPFALRDKGLGVEGLETHPYRMLFPRVAFLPFLNGGCQKCAHVGFSHIAYRIVENPIHFNRHAAIR